MDSGPSDGVLPVKIDPNVKFISIGGLKEHKKCLKEMIIFPIMYPELFSKFDTRPAKGILFHGPPGTGKTLLARALVNECGQVGGRKVSFFFRKGADVQNKYYGESERILRLIFQTARKMKPSIIFFDEIDALAPVRTNTDHGIFNASLVATLLAEMDGVTDRGEVIVIGATNRPEAIDPALRRAGRLDRELYFPAPALEDRREILGIFTQDWDPSLGNDALDYLAKLTVGFLGSDLKSLCSEAVLKAIRRVYPQIYESNYKLLINAQNVEVTVDDMIEAMTDVPPSAARYAPQAAQALPLHTSSLLADQLKKATDLLDRTFPLRSDTSRLMKIDNAGPAVFLVCGECAVSLLAPALLAQLEDCLMKELNVSTLHDSRCASPEEAVVSTFAECRRSGRDCVIFIRDLQAVWNVLARTCGVDVLLQLWNTGLARDRSLILCATNCNYDEIPMPIKQLFPAYKNCMYRMRAPTETEVADFLRPVITELPLVPPVMYQYVPPPPLPRAPTGPLKNEKDEIDRIYREYETLRILRRSLKKVANYLSYESQYRVFSRPADEESLPDYYTVIQNPMDFEKMLNKIQNKRYFCALEFLDDIDLICTNALSYDKHKPNKHVKTLRQDAFALHSDAYSMILEEISPSLELECQIVARRRRASGEDDPEPDLGGWDDDFYLSRLAGVKNSIDMIKLKKIKPYNDEYSRKRSHDCKDMGPSTKRARIIPNVELNGNFTIMDHDDLIPHRSSKYIEDGIVVNVENLALNSNNGVPNISSGNEKDYTDKNKGNEQPSEQLLINAEQLVDILNSNVGALQSVGLGALVDLHAQLHRTVYGYSRAYDRRNLPRDLNEIISRYVQLANEQ